MAFVSDDFPTLNWLSWNGDEYDKWFCKQVHGAVRKELGKASQFACGNCGKQARDWSQVHGTDGLNFDTDFRPMCIPCHRSYDYTPEWRRQRAETVKTWWEENPEERIRRSVRMTGSSRSEEANAKNSATMKQKLQDPEERQKWSEAQQRRYKNETPEAREKRIESFKRSGIDPERRRKQSESGIRRYEDPEERRKTSESQQRLAQIPQMCVNCGKGPFAGIVGLAAHQRQGRCRKSE